MPQLTAEHLIRWMQEHPMQADLIVRQLSGLLTEPPGDTAPPDDAPRADTPLTSGQLDALRRRTISAARAADPTVFARVRVATEDRADWYLVAAFSGDCANCGKYRPLRVAIPDPGGTAKWGIVRRVYVCLPCATAPEELVPRLLHDTVWHGIVADAVSEYLHSHPELAPSAAGTDGVGQ